MKIDAGGVFPSVVDLVSVDHHVVAPLRGDDACPRYRNVENGNGVLLSVILNTTIHCIIPQVDKVLKQTVNINGILVY